MILNVVLSNIIDVRQNRELYRLRVDHQKGTHLSKLTSFSVSMSGEFKREAVVGEQANRILSLHICIDFYRVL